MAFIMEEDILFDPINIRLFGVAGVILYSDGAAHLVQEFFGAVRNYRNKEILLAKSSWYSELNYYR
jgi:hypothetical protein